MNIEFHTEEPGEVNKWLITDLKKKLAQYGDDSKKITGASVYFNRNPNAEAGSYTCVIVLSGFGHSIMVQRSAGSYPTAAGEVIEELSNMVRELTEKELVN